jgi:hypothetical protein
MTKPKRLRLTGYFTCLVYEKHTQFYMENLDERDHLEDRGLDGKVILKFIFKKEGMRMWIRVGVSRWGE